MARLGSGKTARAREMRKLLRQWERSGQTLAEFARQRGVKANTLSWWRYVFRHAAKVGRGTTTTSPRATRDRRREQQAAFVEVKVAAGEAMAAVSSFEVVLPAGAVIRVPQQFDPTSLRALVAALGSPC